MRNPDFASLILGINCATYSPDPTAQYAAQPILGWKSARHRAPSTRRPAQGFYPFRIEYFHKKGEGELAPIYLKPEGVEDFPIPNDMLYSDNHSQKK
jgi:hypothetical protein